MAAASEAAQPLQVPPLPPLPPLPPKLRREPQRSSIGEGLAYADEAAFEADHAAWVVEQRCRRSQVRERERVQDQRRDRSQRQRGTELETDSQRRIRQKRERSQHEKQLAYAQLSACLFASAPAPAAARQPASATPARQPWDQMWSKEVPALVMDHAIPVNPDIWYSRLARHGFVAGNMMTHNMETDALYAVARDLLDIVFDVILHLRSQHLCTHLSSKQSREGA